MEIILGLLVIAAGFGAAKKDGLLSLMADTTYRDTIAFEHQAALQTENRSRERAARLAAILEREDTRRKNQGDSYDRQEHRPRHSGSGHSKS